MGFFRSLKGRFVTSHLLPLLITVPLVAIALLYLIETQILLTDMSTDLGTQAELIAQIAQMQASPDLWINPNEAQIFVAQVNDKGMVGEVVLRAPSGTVLAETNEGSLLTPEFEALSQQIQTLASGEVVIMVSYDLSQPGVQVFAPVLDVNEQLVGIVQVVDSLGTVTERLAVLGRYVLIVLALQLLLGGGIGFALALRLERPITRSTTAVIDLAQGHYVDPPLREMGTTELKALSLSVNDLSERLRILEETRRRSLANLVHEIGRPLGAIKAAISVLLDGADEDPTLRQELLSGISFEVERIQPHLDDLTQLHGNVTGEIHLEKEIINLNEWLPSILLPWRAAAQDKGLNWTTSIHEDLPSLNIDPKKIAQALGNLMSNAVKYTPEGGTVWITAVSTTTTVQISVEDNGPGIAPNEEQRIFEPFYRSTEQRRFPQGLGLGLSIAKDSIEAHDGTLTYEENPKGGSKFTITLVKNVQ